MKLPFIRWFFSLFQLMKSAQVHVDQSEQSTNSENIILISSFISSFFFLNQYKWLEYKFHEWNAQATQVKFHKRNQSISSYEYEFVSPEFPEWVADFPMNELKNIKEILQSTTNLNERDVVFSLNHFDIFVFLCKILRKIWFSINLFNLTKFTQILYLHNHYLMFDERKVKF